MDKFIVILLCFLLSCTSNHRNTENDLKQMTLEKDTILSDNFIKQFGRELKNGNRWLKRTYFDFKGDSLFILKKDDTTYVQMSFDSGKPFKGINKSNSIKLIPLTNNFIILTDKHPNRFKFVIDEFADTIEYDVYISSKNYVFKSGDSVENSVFLCRQKMFPKR